MNDPRLPRLVFGLLLFAGLLYFSQVYAKLPEVIFSHFNAEGVPNGRMLKSTFFWPFPLAALLVAVIMFLAPKLMAILPASMINLPNKDYWLAPERRAETVRYMEAAMAWFGCAFFALLMFALYLAIQVNLVRGGRFDSTSLVVALVAFFVYAIFFLVRVMRHFGRTEQNRS
ncbi:MAG TPA: hypothetical protein VJN42_00805 [Candidatus Acidoferrum sp.]|nr:hypothetical protein [Candidatus Acidoferrum sp.]